MDGWAYASGIRMAGSEEDNKNERTAKKIGKKQPTTHKTTTNVPAV